MTAAVDSLFDEYYRRYTERDMEGVTNLCLWLFVAIRCGEAIHLPTRDAVCDQIRVGNRASNDSIAQRNGLQGREPT